MPAKQDFSDFTKLLAGPLTSRGQLDVVQTGNGTAIDAQKVRMPAVMFLIDRFESPDVVANFGSPKQPSIHHVIQIAENGGLVHTERR
ncbi:hypothetical protein RSSM_00566 [Rhodopirellula sallentina SM41]|uniref:Uncharacterized protein n=1 Tax=Rhodopirellula sallentina SM41 TaxID=1263870 RepID=M5U9B8_9BACT|nr:hypothetical protein RSSM_00566 [Rhodopirellula sallentina SM41]